MFIKTGVVDPKKVEKLAVATTTGRIESPREIMKMTCQDKLPQYKNFDKSNIKCVLVGDPMVGKTSLAKRLANDSFPSEYTPTTFDNYAVTTTVDDKSFVLGLFDTAGQEELKRLRKLAYVNSDVFLVCFSVTSHESLKHAHDNWIREVRSHAPNVPCVLVGTHIDTRDDLSLRDGDRTLSGQRQFVSTKDGMAAAGRMGVDSYVECSSLTEAGIPRLREATVDAVLNGVSSANYGFRCACTIM